MESSRSLLIKREPKSNSFLLSFFGYTFFLIIAIGISYKYATKKEEVSLTVLDKKVMIRENRVQFSISRFSEGLPSTPLVLGVYQSGNDAFYHQFKRLAENYSNIKNINFAMVNLKMIEEMNLFDAMRTKKMIQNFNPDDVPIVLFLYQNKEIEKLRMPLGFTNLGGQELKNRIEGLINFSISPSGKP